MSHRLKVLLAVIKTCHISKETLKQDGLIYNATKESNIAFVQRYHLNLTHVSFQGMLPDVVFSFWCRNWGTGARHRMGSTGQDSVRKGTFWGHSIYFFVADGGFPTDLLDIICTRQSDSLSFELKASLLVIKQKIE